jgi:hypothetical protein
MNQKKSKTPQQEEADRLTYIANTNALAEIIKPVAQAHRTFEYRWNDTKRYVEGLGEDFGGLEMNPDFQRGHVWTPAQQQSFIENVIRGLVSESAMLIQFNCPNWEDDDVESDLPMGLQCIDGLQRYTAVQAYLNGEFKPFGLSIDDMKHSGFALHRHHFKIAMFNFKNKVDILDHYLAFNCAGTPHSEEEIARVRAMREDVVQKK